MVLALAIGASGSLVFAQGGTTSTLNGTVVDTSGAVLPGADVSAKHSTSGVITTAITNTEGAFSLPAMPIGTYVVTVTLQGFKTSVTNNVVLTSTQGANIKATLEVGGVTELVTVSSTSEIIQTQSTTISSTIGTNQITKLPLASRSAMDFVNFLPGVSTPGGNRDATINGLPQGVINITLDGINIQDNTNRSSDGFFALVSPRLDAIEEVSVTTAGQGADAGQGAVQIKFVTRSGGNSYTGSAYHYFRSDKLNANTWFNNRAGTPIAKLKQNQMGARLGGPLVIPGLVPRGKVFFFGNYEELRQPSDTTRNRNLMKPGVQSGNFVLGSSTFNVLAFGAANAGTAATSTVDPTISALLSDIRSAANSVGTIESVDANVDRLVFNVSVTSKRIFPTGRIDYNITDNHRFTSAVNYNYYTDAPDTLNNFDPFWPGFPVQGGQTSKRLSVSNTLRSTLGRNFVNEARVGYSGAPVKFFDDMNVGMFTGTLANQKGHVIGFPNIGSALTSAGATPNPQSRNASDLAIEDTVTWLKGNHNLTSGVSWTGYNVWLKNSRLVPSVSFGLLANDPAQSVFTTANIAAATGVTPSATQLTQIQNLYAFLTGRMSAITSDARLDEATGEYVYVGTGLQRSSMKESGIFAQDSWRLRPNLTINAGVRYDVQFPFTASNNSYSTPTLEDICGRSGVSSNTDGPEGAPRLCNLFQPGNMPGKTNPGFINLEKGKHAYNTDWDNVAPNFGVAWTPARRSGFLGALMSDEFVVRAGAARAYSRNGMGDFTGVYNANPGVTITASRTEALTGGNSITATTGGSAPVLFRNDANLAPAAFANKPVYPMFDVVTQDISMFDPNIQIPYADSYTAGFQRRVSTNMALEIRYVGTRSRDAWTNRDFNERNLLENNFLTEFRAAQANLQANIAAGRGATFAYTGVAGTSPLPNMNAYLSGANPSQAGNTAAYTGSSYTNATFIGRLAARNPSPNNLVGDILGTAALRANGAAAGMPANFFIANPDYQGGALVTLNSHKTNYNSLQVELRRRLAQGLQFQTSYVLGKAMQTVLLNQRQGIDWFRDTGTPGDLTHQFKANVVYDLPFGQGRRFVSGAGSIMERIVGGWQIGVTTRIQSGRLVDTGSVRLVGWNEDDVQKAFKLRFDDAGKVIYNWPEDVVTNTVRAFSVSATSANGYSGAAPEGRYFAPANNESCILNATGEECPGVLRSLILQGPLFQQTDIRLSKRTKVVGRVNVEFAAEALNAFNTANFVPNVGISSTLSNWTVTGLTGANTARVVQLVSRVNW
jgi:hypothetical protein